MRNEVEVWWGSYEYLMTLDYLNGMFSDIIQNTLGE